MAKKGFKILDSDMHIMEPPDLWERYIDSRYRAEAPRGVISSNARPSHGLSRRQGLGAENYQTEPVGPGTKF